VSWPRPIPWLRRLSHETLCPTIIRKQNGCDRFCGPVSWLRSETKDKPVKLVARWTAAAEASVAAYHRRWSPPDAKAWRPSVRGSEAEKPRLLITAGPRIVLGCRSSGRTRLVA
jgi:hypothetical protein